MSETKEMTANQRQMMQAVTMRYQKSGAVPVQGMMMMMSWVSDLCC